MTHENGKDVGITEGERELKELYQAYDSDTPQREKEIESLFLVVS